MLVPDCQGLLVLAVLPQLNIIDVHLDCRKFVLLSNHGFKYALIRICTPTEYNATIRIVLYKYF